MLSGLFNLNVELSRGSSNQTERFSHDREEFEAEDFVKKYARTCLKPFPRQLVGVILLGAGKVC